MKICIDATPLLVRSVGVKTYLYYWLEHLLQASEPGTIQMFPRIRRLGSLNHDASHLEFISTALRLGLVRAANHKVPFARDLLMPKADLFHMSQLFWDPPTNIPVTGTIYDFTVWLRPDLHPSSNIKTDKNFIASSLKRAKSLIAISENTRADAVRLLGIAPERIEVIYPGVSEAFYNAAARPVAGLTKPYILFVGTIEPRKNVASLLDAYEQLPDSTRDEYDLVITGPSGWKSEGTMARLRQPPRGVRYLGYVAQPDMPSLFAGATVVAYPSLYEGFGFPVAEAMACGVPVITSRVSSLPEVAGAGALLVDPNSVAEIRAALDKLLGDSSLRAQVGKAGAERARKMFRWSTCAQQSLAFFTKVLAN